jgi:hypothetical protein
MVYLSDFDEAVTDFMADFSGPAIVTVYQEGAYDPATGDVSTTTTDYAVKAILLDIEIRSSGYSTVSGTLIEAGDKRAFIQPPEKYSTQVMPVPRPNKDKFTMGNVTYKIVTSKQINPATDGAILYELILRQ